MINIVEVKKRAYFNIKIIPFFFLEFHFYYSTLLLFDHYSLIMLFVTNCYWRQNDDSDSDGSADADADADVGFNRRFL